MFLRRDKRTTNFDASRRHLLDFSYVSSIEKSFWLAFTPEIRCFCHTPLVYESYLDLQSQIVVQPLFKMVNVPPVSDRRLLRSCLRWPRPGQKVVGCMQDVRWPRWYPGQAHTRMRTNASVLKALS